MKFLNNIDLNKNQTLNRVVQQLGTAPGSPTKGQEYFDTTTNATYVYNGTTWVSADASKLSGTIPMAALTTDPTARANHTGTQTASTISDLATVVKAYKLNEFAAPVANVAMGGFTLTGLSTSPNASGQAAEYSWVQAQIQASAAGIDAKPSVVCIYTANVASKTGFIAVDGVTPTAGQRILLVAQTTASENGVYVAAAGAWARDTDVITPQTFWLVEQGTTFGGSQWKVSTTGTIVTGTTPLTVVQFGAGSSYTAGNGLQLVGSVFSVLLPASSGLTVSGSGVAIDTTVVARKFSATIGDGTTTAIAVTHSLGTQDIQVSVRDASTNVAYQTDWTATSTSVATINFAVAPTASSLRVTIIG